MILEVIDQDDKSVWNVETLPKQDGIIAYRLTRKAD